MKTNTAKELMKVVANFDFRKVHKAMQKLNWTYEDGKIPDEYRLKDLAIWMLLKVATTEGGEISTGGFFAQKLPDNTFKLSFVLEEYGTICEI